MEANRAVFHRANRALEVYTGITGFLLIANILYKDALLLEESFKSTLMFGYLKVLGVLVAGSTIDAAKMLTALTILAFIFYVTPRVEEAWLLIIPGVLHSLTVVFVIPTQFSLSNWKSLTYNAVSRATSIRKRPFPLRSDNYVLRWIPIRD